MKNTKRVGVVVLGMHRSGTSALARVLNFLGCDMPANLVDAGVGNEAGHWEPMGMVSLNDQIFESAGSYMLDWTSMSSDWFESPKASDFRHQASAVIRAEFGDSRLFVAKDPRVCRTFPLWSEAIIEAGATPVVMFPLRNPIEVADSLNKRNGFDTSWGYLVWLSNVLDAERDSRGVPRFFLTYEMLLDNWGKVADAAQGVLGIKWPISLEKAAPNVERFLSKERRHHKATSSNLLDNPVLSPWLKDVYRVMLEWAQNGENEADYEILDRVRSEMKIAAPAFGRAVAAGWGAAQWGRQLEQKRVELTTRLENDRQAAAEREKRIEGLNHRVEELETAVADYESRAVLAAKIEEDRDRAMEQAARLNHRIEELETAVADYESRTVLAAKIEEDRDRAFVEVARLKHAIKAADVNLADRFGEIVKLTEMVQRAETDRNELAAKLGEAEVNAEATNAMMQRLNAELKQSASQAEANKIRATELNHRIVEAITGSGGWTLVPRFARYRMLKSILARTGLFDADWYKAHYSDIAASGIDPLDHFIRYGAREGRYWGSEISTLAAAKALQNASTSSEANG